MELVGVPWTQSTVALIETGRRQVTAVELVALSAVLRTPIASLLAPGADQVVAVGDATWTAAFLRRIASGDVENLDDEPREGTYDHPPEIADTLRRLKQIAPVALQTLDALLEDFAAQWELDTTMSIRQFRAIALAAGPVEREAATRIRRTARRAGIRRLITSRDVAAAAWRLWKSSYEDERERRVNEKIALDVTDRSRQAIRGHVARELDREVRDEVRLVLGDVSSPNKGKVKP